MTDFQTTEAEHRCVGGGAENVVGEAISGAMLLFVANIATVVLAPMSREIIALEEAAKEQEGRD